MSSQAFQSSAGTNGEGKVFWKLCVDVKIEGIRLPFRLRVTADDEEKILDALSDFQSMIQEKLDQFGPLGE
jgi:hypothetical protein